MKSVTQIALANDKANRSRSILITISIVLTTMLLMVIATWGTGMVKSQKANAGNMYGRYYGRFKNVNEEQVKEMNRRSEFTDIGKMSYVGEVENKLKMYLYCADKTTRELANMDSSLEKGSYPKAVNEIAAQEKFFESIGYPDVKPGDKIHLNYRPDSASKYAPEEFIVSGILRGNELQKNNYTAYVSEEYYNQKTEEENRLYVASFRLSDGVSVNMDNDEEVIQNLGKKIGVPKKNVQVNTYYLMWALDPGTETIAGCAMIAVLVILFSVVVIYNIFQVGITQKIQEYGKLKALGMTRKQLKQVIGREGMFLAVIGVPIGLLLGYLISVVSFDTLMYKNQSIQENLELVKVSLFSVPAVLAAALLSFATVWLALKKPMKIVASVSAIEAIRYQESSKSKRSSRKGKELLNVNGLMLANLSQNRKRTFTTILTMGLSCVLFVVMANFVGNMDEEYEARRSVEHGQFQIELDWSMNDEAYPQNNLENILKDNPLDSQTVERIKAIDGVKEVRTRKIFIMDVQGHGPMTVSVLDKEEIQKLEEGKSYEGSFDYEKAAEKDAIFYGSAYYLEMDGFAIGQSVSATLPDGTAFDTSIQGAIGPVADTEWLMTEDTFQSLNLKGEWNGYIYVDCEEKDLKQVQDSLAELFADAEHIEISTYQDALKTSAFQMQMLEFAVYAFLLIIGLIGFMNLANTMITNVITRRQEFGVLQAVGMTNRQLNRMLQREGMLFTIGTIVVSMVFGIPLGYAVFGYGKSHSFIGLNIYHFPVVEICLMFVVIVILQLILSFVLSRNIKKDSLVERIRYQG